MVNHGRSGRCSTCKERRVKCDEARPACRCCQRLGLKCGGYESIGVARLKFKNQNYKFDHAQPQRARGRDKRPLRRCQEQPRLPIELALDTSIPFFLKYYSILGRGFESTRGFFEILAPTFFSEPYDSAFNYAVTFVATLFESLWKYGPVALRTTSPLLARALNRLRAAIRDPSESHEPSTMFAALVLQHYENISAAFGSHRVPRTHHDGALALLSSLAPKSNLRDKNTGYLMKFILHTEISSALREGRPVPDHFRSWLGDLRLMSTPSNPSSILDKIGMAISDLRSEYLLLSSRGCFPPCSETNLPLWREKIDKLDMRLSAWADEVPVHWRPLRLATARDIKPSVLTYLSGCDVYPSCQIATIWNVWRCYRLMVLQMRAALLCSFGVLRAHSLLADYAACKAVVQELVDGICYSVPFFLGDRTKPSRITDFENSEISLPTSHGVSLDEAEGRTRTKREEHYQHMVAQGPWHIMGALGRLLTLFNEQDGQLLMAMLRPRQRDWMRQQFLRVVTILNLPTQNGSRGGYSVSGPRKILEEPIDETRADHVALEIRERLALAGGF